MKQEKLEIEMWNFTADTRYFSFNYKVKRNGVLVDEGEINNDYQNGNTPKQQVEELQDEYGLVLVMHKVF
jgi:hypothetical protein